MAAVGTEDRDLLLPELTELLIVADECSALFRLHAEDVAAEEETVIRHPEERQNGGRHIDLTALGQHRSRLDECRRIEDQWNPIAFHLELVLAGRRGGVVGDNDKKCVVEPRFGPRIPEELSDGEITVLDGALPARPRRNIDPTVGIGVGPVVRCRHDKEMER